MTTLQKATQAILLTLVFLLVIIRPLYLKGGPSGDFMTIFRLTRDFWHGVNIYSGGNPYLPSTYLIMGYQTAMSSPPAWLVWRLIGIALSLATGVILYKSLASRLGHWTSGLVTCNVLLLSGMSPWSGNPGNLAGIACVLSYALLLKGSPTIAGIALGLATGLKYSLGLPLIGLGLLARYTRFASVAVITFVLVNSIALLYMAAHGTTPIPVMQSVLSGVTHVGGYDDSGYHRWFSTRNPYRFQLMNILPLLDSLHVPTAAAHALCLTILAIASLAAAYLSLTARPPLLLGAALFSPFFLMTTYHRFYDSALLAFPVLLAWTANARGMRPWAFSTIVCSCAYFLSFSNIVQTRVLANSEFLNTCIWNYIIGPHHWYALIAMSLSVSVLAIQLMISGKALTANKSPRELP